MSALPSEGRGPPIEAHQSPGGQPSFSDLIQSSFVLSSLDKGDEAVVTTWP